MRAIHRVILDTSIVLLFIKGLLLVPVTILVFTRAFLAREPPPAVGVASCAAGTLAFGMACFAIWIRGQLDPASSDHDETGRTCAGDRPAMVPPAGRATRGV